MLSRGRAALYLQHGAGLAQLIRPIASLPHGSGTRLLDIGCGFGFGLDYAIRARGWTGLGIDPAGIAALGARRLGLPIEQRLLGDDEPAMRGAFDVVMAAETIEHVPDPAAFVRILVSAMAEAGVLVLTTPDADAIRPQAPKGQLAGLLSPGLHVVLQSEHSLRRLLGEAGLGHVRISRDGGALVATASRVALPPVPEAADMARALLAHLVVRARAFTPEDDLFWGFAGRALLEAVNAGAWEVADDLLARLQAACRQRFAIDLARPGLFEETASCSLERMAVLTPLNLGGLLYGEAMLRLGQGGARAEQVQRLALAAEALRRLGRAVAALGMADPMSEALGWAAEAEGLLCAVSALPRPGAQSDPAPACELARRLMALPPAPGDDGFGRREVVRLQAFVTLVNAAQYEAARKLRSGCAECDAPRVQQGQDAVYARAMLALQPGGDPDGARHDFSWLRLRLTAARQAAFMPMLWSALRGEAQALVLLQLESEASLLLETVTCAMAEAGEAVPSDLRNAA